MEKIPETKKSADNQRDLPQLIEAINKKLEKNKSFDADGLKADINHLFDQCLKRFGEVVKTKQNYYTDHIILTNHTFIDIKERLNKLIDERNLLLQRKNVLNSLKSELSKNKKKIQEEWEIFKERIKGFEKCEIFNKELNDKKISLVESSLSILESIGKVERDFGIPPSELERLKDSPELMRQVVESLASEVRERYRNLSDIAQEIYDLEQSIMYIDRLRKNFLPKLPFECRKRQLLFNVDEIDQLVLNENALTEEEQKILLLQKTDYGSDDYENLLSSSDYKHARSTLVELWSLSEGDDELTALRQEGHRDVPETLLSGEKVYLRTETDLLNSGGSRIKQVLSKEEFYRQWLDFILKSSFKYNHPKYHYLKYCRPTKVTASQDVHIQMQQDDWELSHADAGNYTGYDTKSDSEYELNVEAEGKESQIIRSYKSCQTPDYQPTETGFLTWAQRAIGEIKEDGSERDQKIVKIVNVVKGRLDDIRNRECYKNAKNYCQEILQKVDPDGSIRKKIQQS